MVMAAAKSVMKVELAKLCRLGIDEISLVKGQGKFIRHLQKLPKPFPCWFMTAFSSGSRQS
jgi:hypothetical protein